MKTYKPVFRNQIILLKYIFRDLLIFAIAYVLFIVIEFHEYYLEGAKIFTAAFILADLFPSLILYLQYINYSEDMEINVDSTDRTFDIKVNNVNHSFAFDQIKSVRIVITQRLRNNSFNRFAWNIFHYSIVEIEKGEKYYITFFFQNDLRKFFADLKINAIIENSFFPWITTYKYERSKDGW